MSEMPLRRITDRSRGMDGVGTNTRPPRAAEGGMDTVFEVADGGAPGHFRAELLGEGTPTFRSAAGKLAARQLGSRCAGTATSGWVMRWVRQCCGAGLLAIQASLMAAHSAMRRYWERSPACGRSAPRACLRVHIGPRGTWTRLYSSISSSMARAISGHGARSTPTSDQ